MVRGLEVLMLKTIYPVIKKLLFKLEPEQSHHLAMKSLAVANAFGMLKLLKNNKKNPQTCMRLFFPNKLGLGAGIDKNGDYIDALSKLGFGFIEIGTVTPKPQAGNPRPRLFRLSEHEAIINRMGFSNKGMEYVAKRLAKMKYQGILGINIGKNKDTPLSSAHEDYLLVFRRLWKFASYLTINVSSPNTPGLRNLQSNEALNQLLVILKNEQKAILQMHKKYIPLTVKISPDLTEQEIADVAQTLLANEIDGVIATNTTLGRQFVTTSIHANEAGGLSGKPLTDLSTNVIKQLHIHLKDRIPIIAVGGIMDAASAQEKINAGASLLQIYTGFIYHGPQLIHDILKSI